MADKNIRNIKMGLIPEFSSILIISGLFYHAIKCIFSGKVYSLEPISRKAQIIH
jgi:hypothetical protein